MSRNKRHPQTAYRRRAVTTAAPLTGTALFTAAPPLAAAGLGGWEIYYWAFAGFALVLMGGLVLAIVLLVKRMRQRQAGPESRSRNLILSGVAILCLLLGAPIYLFVIGVRELETSWWLGVVAYLVMLACTLFALIDNRKIVTAILGAILLTSILQRPGVISFTDYTIVENQPFEPTHTVAERRGKNFFQTTDANLYRLLGQRQLPGPDRFSPGTTISVEAQSISMQQKLYDIRIADESYAYERHMRRYEDPWLIVPLRHATIEKYSAWLIGQAELLTGSDWEATDAELLEAIFAGCCDPDWIAELIMRGADPTAKLYANRNLLHYLADDLARHDGMVAAARVLGDAGVDVNARDQWGKTPLYLAIGRVGSRYRENPEIEGRVVGFITALLEAGADPDIVTEHGETPLLEAVISRHYELAQLLLEHGADPTIASASGSDPIAVASRALEDNPSPILDDLVRAMRETHR